MWIFTRNNFILAQVYISYWEETTSVLGFALAFGKLRSLSLRGLVFRFLMWVLTKIREVNYRCSRKRWFFHGYPGSRRTLLHLHKSQKVDTAARYSAPLPTAAAIRLSRIASALSRICNVPAWTIISLKEYRDAFEQKAARLFDIALNHGPIAQVCMDYYKSGWMEIYFWTEKLYWNNKNAL